MASLSSISREATRLDFSAVGRLSSNFCFLSLLPSHGYILLDVQNSVVLIDYSYITPVDDDFDLEELLWACVSSNCQGKCICNKLYS